MGSKEEKVVKGGEVTERPVFKEKSWIFLLSEARWPCVSINSMATERVNDEPVATRSSSGQMSITPWILPSYSGKYMYGLGLSLGQNRFLGAEYRRSYMHNCSQYLLA